MNFLSPPCEKRECDWLNKRRQQLDEQHLSEERLFVNLVSSGKID